MFDLLNIRKFQDFNKIVKLASFSGDDHHQQSEEISNCMPYLITESSRGKWGNSFTMLGTMGIEKESNDELTNYFENGTKLRVI